MYRTKHDEILGFMNKAISIHFVTNKKAKA